MFIKQVTGNCNDWILKDEVRNCEFDIELDVLPDSIEVNKIFLDGVGTVLFAYKVDFQLTEDNAIGIKENTEVKNYN